MPVEKNTYPASAFIAAPLRAAYEYLCSLPKLGEWTLNCKMQEQVDEDTWLGTASGFHQKLYYHIKRFESARFLGIEWHCGLEYKKYGQIYPVLLFPPDYVEPGSDEQGVYFHWVSFADPSRRNAMFMEGIKTVHDTETRSLKARLERAAGHRSAVPGRHRIVPDTIYIDAPVELGGEFLFDLRNFRAWNHLLEPAGELEPHKGAFTDEYGKRVEVSLHRHRFSQYDVIEVNASYPEFDFHQRSPMLLIPCAYAFGNPAARGFILHRLTFWKEGARPEHGKLLLEEYGAESMNMKRTLEALAGNLDTFPRGMSYLPPPAAPEPKGPVMESPA